MDLLAVYQYLLFRHPGEASLVGWLAALLAALYSSALVIAVWLLLRRRRRGAASPLSLSVMLLCGSVLVPAFAGIVLAAYAFAIEPNWLEVKRVKLTSAKLRGAIRPIRLVQISDTHCNPTARLEEIVPDVAAALHPDLILFTGDTINSRGGLPVFKHMMTRLSAIAPVYAVKGNYDSGYWTDLDLFGGTGVEVLNSRSVDLDIAGARMSIAGVPAGEQALTLATKEAACDRYIVFLNHYSDAIMHLVRMGKVDLYLSGHTHGGQIALPFYGAICTLSQFGKRFEAGLFKVGQAHLYVNRGLGMSAPPYPPARFCARPELTVIDLSPEPEPVPAAAGRSR